jgi:hypothetical protein
MHSFHQLMDMMRNASNDGTKRVYNEDGGMGGHIDAESLMSVGVPSSSSSSAGLFGSAQTMNLDMNKEERFSRKVFVGGLPPDIDEGKRKMTLVKFFIFIHCLSRGDHCSFSTFRSTDCRLAA